MSEKVVICIPSNLDQKSIREYLGLTGKSSLINKKMSQIYSIMALHSVDEETCLALLKSFELHHKSDDITGRLDNFLKFISSISERDDLIGTVKSMGMLSKSELEQQAVLTGNWIPFMKRVESDKERERAQEISLINE